MPIDEDLRLWNLLDRTRHAIFKTRTKDLNRFNLSIMQSSVFNVVWALGEKATPAEISRWLFREPSSVSDLIGRMEKEGLVKKIRNAVKKNKVKVVLTEKGQDARSQATKLESIHKIMSALSKEERQQLEVSLEKLWYKAREEFEGSLRPPFPES